MERKTAFFDIDGTLTSELDGTIPESVGKAITKARENGHLMFINTGRCMQNVEKRFLDIGFDGVISGCGTNIYCNTDGMFHELLYVSQTHAVTYEILTHARQFELDILFESKKHVCFDNKKTLLTEGGIKQYTAFVNRHYDMSLDPEADSFTCDKFVVWFKNVKDLPAFREVSDKYFICIDRGGNFREFVPIGYSKATGIQFILDYYHLPIESSYSFGDSNNDLPMLDYTKYSIAMGNSIPPSLFEQVTYVSAKASQNGIQQALQYYNFI
ncbi:MAG: HAD-IIB family hydrolase [Tannerellaceae bacterium]|nr:HAD-IIB family hydrolase [Tannerellaceae bacterium]